MKNELMNSVREKVMARLVDDGYTMTSRQWDHYSKLVLLFNEKEMIGNKITNPKALEGLLYNFFVFHLEHFEMLPDEKIEKMEPIQEWLINFTPQKKQE